MDGDAKKGKKKKKGSSKGSIKRKGSKKKGSKRGGSKRRANTDSIVKNSSNNKIQSKSTPSFTKNIVPSEIWKQVLKTCLPPLTGAREGRERLRMMLVCKEWNWLVWALTNHFEYEDKPQGYLDLLAERKRETNTHGEPLTSFASSLKQVDDNLVSWISTSFSSLTSLNLAHCDHVTDEGLRPLSALSQLTDLSLSYLSSVSDSGLGRALVGLKSLRKLAVTQTDNLQGSFLKSCAPSLEVLDLTDGKSLTVADLAPLAGLTKLTELLMMHCGSGVNCSVFDYLPPALVELKVSGFLLLEQSVERLSHYSSLKELALSFTFFNQKRLKALALLKSLNHLEAIDVREASFLEEIGSLGGLEHLRIVARFYATRFGPTDLVPLTNLKGLKSLCLDTSGPENDGLHHISQLSNLESITLSMPIYFESFKFLQGITTLRTLRVVRCEGVKKGAFKKLTSLTELYTTCDDPEAKGIGHLSSLQSLSLDNCRVCSLRFIAKLTNLRTLSITACRSMKDAYIEELLSSPSSLPHTLTHLDLSFCGSIGDPSVPHLLQLTSLRTLRLLGSTISSANLNLLDLRLIHLQDFAYPKRLEPVENGK